MKKLSRGCALTLIGSTMAVIPLSVPLAADAAPDPSLVQKMRAHAQGGTQISQDSASGRLGLVRAKAGGDLMPTPALGRRDDAVAAARAKARAWLDAYAPTFGARPAELSQSKIVTDRYGVTLTYAQTYRGLPVFGAMVKANVDNDGDLTAVSGFTAPDLALETGTRHSAAEAGDRAVALVTRKAPTGADGRAGSTAGLKATAVTKSVYRIGSTRGTAGRNIVAFTTIVTNGKNIRDLVILDANSLKAVNRWSMVNENLDRDLSTYNDATQAVDHVWTEGDDTSGLAQDQKNMLASTAETYALFKNTFGRDSYDGAGAQMRLLHNSPEGCPNASWNGLYTQYCDGVEDDDTVAHEWGHAYTEYTAGLVYQWQSGALNESYSDVWGETVDLLNNREDETEGDLTTKRPDGLCSSHTRGGLTATIDAPAAVAGACEGAFAANFGPQFSTTGTTGTVVVATDADTDGSGTADTTTDGCDPIDNAAAVVGKWAYVDRGTCAFADKLQHVVDAGAAGIVVGNTGPGGLNLTGNWPDLYGVMVSQNDGTRIKNAGAPVTLTVTEQPRQSADSYRWLLSEGSTAFGGAIRDMWNPTCYGDPGKVTDAEYKCSADDQGGVHGNSGVPNHAYALLVDGGSYNGQTVTGLGLDKAAALYYRSLTAYLTATSDFVDQADALEASCADLSAASAPQLKKLTLEPGATAPDAGKVTAADCAQVAAVNTAVEFRTSPASTCEWQPMFEQNAPSSCGEGFDTVDVWSEDFNDGLAGWTKDSDIVYSGGLHTPWAASNNAPDHHAGGVAYGPAPEQGTCSEGAGDYSSVDWLISPPVAIPSGGASPRLRFDHYVATEVGYDGGVVQYRANGGEWTTVPADAYTFNAPQGLELGEDDGGDNTNPLAGQDGFTGTDPGAARSTWGTSIIDLASAGLPATGTVEFRFGIGRDGCGGIDGWYLDNVTFEVCEVATTVTASVAPASPRIGQPATVTATVKRAGEGLQPRGTVQLRDATGTVLATAETASGTPVTLAVPRVAGPGGTQKWAVVYLGNGRYSGSKTVLEVKVVDPNAPVSSKLALKVKPGTVKKGKAFKLTAKVSAAKPASGRVTFTLDGKKLGTAPLRSGVATFTVRAGASKKLKVGKHTAKATFAGSRTVKASSATLQVRVKK